MYVIHIDDNSDEKMCTTFFKKKLRRIGKVSLFTKEKVFQSTTELEKKKQKTHF